MRLLRETMAILAAVGLGVAVPRPGSAQLTVDSITAVAPVENAYPAWSPDGKKLVFQSNRTGHNVLYVMNLDGSGTRSLTEDQFNSVTPAWSPDGQFILYVSNEDGRWEDLWLVRPDGTDRRNVTRTPTINESHPHWAPDGRSIIFNATDDVSDDGNEEVYEMDLETSIRDRLTEYDAWDTFASISPDGRMITWRRVLLSGPAGGQRWDSEVFVMNRDGSGVRNVTADPSFDGYPRWSPDSRHIVFSSNRSGTFQLWVVDAGGGNLQRLTESVGEDVRPAWSPDGRSIAFNRDQDGNIVILMARVREEGE